MSARAGLAASASVTTAAASHIVFDWVYHYQNVNVGNTLRR